MPTAPTFNRACVSIALLVLIALVPASVVLRRNYQDFSHFYLGGQVARHGLWGDLYPVPRPGSAGQASMQDASDMRPGYARLAEEYKVDEGGQPFRFAQPPPNALLYLPLAYLSYPNAHLAWVVVSCLCAWVVALQAGWVLQ